MTEQLGHSKDPRPDLPQLKIMQAALDPLGMPVATQVVSGEKADDPLYVPAITQVRPGLGQRGWLYVGDSKRLALDTRAFIQAGDDYYPRILSLSEQIGLALGVDNPRVVRKRAFVDVEIPLLSLTKNGPPEVSNRRRAVLLLFKIIPPSSPCPPAGQKEAGRVCRFKRVQGPG